MSQLWKRGPIAKMTIENQHARDSDNTKDMSIPSKALEIFEAGMVAMKGHGKDTNQYLGSGAIQHVIGGMTCMQDVCIVGPISNIRWVGDNPTKFKERVV